MSFVRYIICVNMYGVQKMHVWMYGVQKIHSMYDTYGAQASVIVLRWVLFLGTAKCVRFYRL